MKSIDKKILKLYEDHKQKEKILIHLKNIEDLIVRRKTEIASLNQVIEKEAREVQQLEQLNLFSLFQTVLGNREEQLEKERQEYLQAILQHKGLMENLNSLEDELALVKRMISGKFSVKKDLDKLLKEKEQLIMKEQSAEFELVFEVADRLSGHQCKIMEIRQAIYQGKETQKTLDKIAVDFKTIERWESGVKFRVTARVKTKLKRIEKNILRANNNIQRFYEELLDLHDHFEMDYESQIESIRDFLKQIVDSMITDWVVLKQLQNSLHLVSGIHDKISLMTSMLELEIKKTEEYILIEQKEKQEQIIEIIRQKKEENPE